MKKICECCKEKDTCSYLKRGKEDECIDVQTYDMGYEAATDKMCEILNKRNQFMGNSALWIDTIWLKKEMEK